MELAILIISIVALFMALVCYVGIKLQMKISAAIHKSLLAIAEELKEINTTLDKSK